MEKRFSRNATIFFRKQLESEVDGLPFVEEKPDLENGQLVIQQKVNSPDEIMVNNPPFMSVTPKKAKKPVASLKQSLSLIKKAKEMLGKSKSDKDKSSDLIPAGENEIKTVNDQNNVGCIGCMHSLRIGMGSVLSYMWSQ